ncbi:MAG: diadenylate cyclase CdaA [Phycisphaeraceae bacterium]|nr:diadenylate cyclase CdaA [Phycisphaeraceae bacterium]
MFFQQLDILRLRIADYLRTSPWEVLLELAIIWLLVLLIVRFLQGTRGARAIRGMVVILAVATVVIQVVGRDEAFQRLGFLYRSSLGFFALALVVVFQPELRRALVRLGEASLFGGRGLIRKSQLIDEVLKSVTYCSRNKIGMLMALERQVGLRALIETGTKIDALVSSELLNTIFWPGSALHDMGVVISEDRIVAAGVQFPLAEGEQYTSELGSRHRAAIGLSLEADCLILVVSEETGTISIAERGQLIRHLELDDVRSRLTASLTQSLGRPEVEPTPEASS